jgi:deoxyribodipyrimidine photo-lyase
MSSALVWFRRDLRDHDHAALYHALKNHERVHCVFVFDTTILDPLPRVDRRVEFILRAVEELDTGLREKGGGLIVRHGDPLAIIPQLAIELGVAAVYANRDYEPAAVARDAEVKRRLASADFCQFKDQVIFEQSEVLTQGGTPFGVFTPYKNAWLKKLESFYLQAYPVAKYATHLAPAPRAIPTLDELGFQATDLARLKLPLAMSGAQSLFADFVDRIDDYAEARNYPAVKGPSYLSTHLRFGTISIRQLAAYAYGHGGRGAETWLSELIWRDFYHMLLHHYPRVVGACYKPAFDALQWDEAPDLLTAWQQGRTGYPLVDAAQRQLLESGYMHNRLRMVSASFLTKDLGLDWRLGEAWFAEKLLDFDLAANNGGWQWAASTGCDAQPWFRIFNPVTQSEKFDPQGKFIRRYVPELAHLSDKTIHAPWQVGGVPGYPPPVVDHAEARARTLARYKAITG